MAKTIAGKRKRNRAAQDATLINVRALKARIALMEKQFHNVALASYLAGIKDRRMNGQEPTRDELRYIRRNVRAEMERWLGR